MDLYRKILLPLDGTPRSEVALPVACEFALRFGAELHLLVAYDISSALLVGQEESLPADLTKLKEHQRRRVESYLQHKAEEIRARGIAVHTVAKGEDAREAICQYAALQEIDVVIMHSGGRSGWMRFLTGSVAEEVLRHAPCPVLILRQPTPAAES